MKLFFPRNELIELHRAATFGKLSDGLFHDLINLLTTFTLSVGRGTQGGETKEIVETAERIGTYAKAVREHIRGNKEKEAFLVGRAIEDALALAGHAAREAGIEVLIEGDRDVRFEGNRARITQAILNLLMNAIDACDKEERYIHIGVTKKYGYIRIAISDNGKGIPEKHIRHIFKPFWSTKSHAKGMGMGLSTVQMIVEDECRGTVEVQSKEREGTSVILTLPPSLTKKKRRIE